MKGVGDIDFKGRELQIGDVSLSSSVPLVDRQREAERAPYPLLYAARALLSVIERFPKSLDGVLVQALHEALLNESRVFLKLCSKLAIDSETAGAASYALCAALDELALKSRWGAQEAGGLDWQFSGISSCMGYDRQGADGVFELIDRALAAPELNEELLMLFKRLLDLGFQGRTRLAPNGASTLKQVRGGLQAALQYSTTTLARQSPRESAWNYRAYLWVGEAQAAKRRRRRYAAGLFGMLALGAAGYLMLDKWVIPMVMPAPAPQPVLEVVSKTLASRLESEMVAGIVDLEPAVAHGEIRMRFSGVYASGDDRLAQWAGPLLANTGKAIATESSRLHVKVVGYADSSVAAGHAQRANLQLSERRANEVARILAMTGVPSSRISVIGKGDAEPLADNGSATGREKNRRVEIILSERDGAG